MAEQTRYDRNDELPPASPRHDCECKFCDYEARCGKTGVPFQDIGVKGLLTLFDGYEEQPLKEYLGSQESARLTPTLAHNHPDLSEAYSVLIGRARRVGSVKSGIAWNGMVILTHRPSALSAVITTI